MSSIDMMMQVGGNLYAMVTFAVAKVRVMYVELPWQAIGITTFRSRSSR